ncbi:MAG: polysaccharide deacetylase family protein [Chloroflexi bacterium]|nr:polysaccharide deacetylase family protein [Chloroflexota bacterium]
MGSSPGAAWLNGQGNGNTVKQVLRKLVRWTGLRRSTVAAARMCCERNVLARVGRRQPRAGGRILCYHSVGQPMWGVNDVHPDQFRRQIETAMRAGYRFVQPSEIAASGGGPRDLAITFDDGLKSVRTVAAPILAEYDIPWALFAVSDWADGRHAFGDDVMLDWDEIASLARDGVEIGSHSVTHPNFGALEPAAVAQELGESRRTIASRIGLTPATFAIPLGQSANWTAEAGRAARAAGYTTVYAQAEETRPNETTPRTFITRWDHDSVFLAALGGVFDRWEEWV